jgi:hypothetical protein
VLNTITPTATTAATTAEDTTISTTAVTTAELTTINFEFSKTNSDLTTTPQPTISQPTTKIKIQSGKSSTTASGEGKKYFKDMSFTRFHVGLGEWMPPGFKKIRSTTTTPTHSFATTTTPQKHSFRLKTTPQAYSFATMLTPQTATPSFFCHLIL